MDQFEFYEQLQSHIGGLVQVCYRYPDLTDQIGILVSAELTYVWPSEDPDAVGVELLIGGRVIKHTFYPGELEIIGGDNAS
jgi:hypothetical protein